MNQNFILPLKLKPSSFIIPTFLFLALFARVASCVELTLVYWGDRHSQNLPHLKIADTDSIMVGGAVALAGMVSELRQASERILVLVAGGEFGGAPVSLMSEGLSQIKILNSIGIDGFLPGNHEFDHGYQSLLKAARAADFPLFLSNVVLSATFAPLFIRDTVFYLPDIMVGLTGLIYPEFPAGLIHSKILDIEVLDPFLAAKSFVRKRRDSCDLLVVMTYFGWEWDSTLAADVPGLDVIIDGRSAVPFDVPRMVNGVIITQAGSDGEQLGRLILEVDTSGGGVLHFKNDILTIEPDAVPKNKKLKKLIKKLEKKYTKKLDSQIGRLQTDWHIADNMQSNAVQWIADVLKEILPSAKLSLINNSILHKDLKRGPVTERDVYEMIPYEHPVVIFQISALELKHIIKWQIAGEDKEFLTWGGLRLRSVEDSIEVLTVNNNYLTEAMDQAVLTTGQVWENFEKYLNLRKYDRPAFYLPDANLRDLIIEEIKSKRVIISPLDDRWIVE